MHRRPPGTGKTAIALDTILKPKSLNATAKRRSSSIDVYVEIGQKRSTVASSSGVEEQGALEYHIVAATRPIGAEQ